MRHAWLKSMVSVVLALGGASLALAQETAPRALDNEPRIWRALSGDMLELDGTILRLHGVRCPDTQSEDGRAAKALLNTFLRGGEIECRMWQSDSGPRASCAKEGRDVATGMIRSGLCKPFLSDDGTQRDATAPDIGEPVVVARLGATSLDRRQFLENLCHPRSVSAKPDVRFFNRCPEEVVRKAIDKAVENQLNPDRRRRLGRDPFSNALFFH